MTVASTYGCADKASFNQEIEGKSTNTITLATDVSVVRRAFVKDGFEYVTSIRDSVIRIYNPGVDKKILYFNIVPDAEVLPRTIVDKILVDGKMYNRGDKGTESIFSDGDSIYQAGVKFIEESKKKELEAKVNEILQK
jgi:hypothetical protein